MPRLCVFQCEQSGVSMHRFPNHKKHPEQFKAWVTIARGKLETSFDYEYYQKQRVCDIHFKEIDRVRLDRLSVNAVPTLHLPCCLDCPVMEKEQPSTSTHIKSTTPEQGQPDYSVVMEQEQPSIMSTDFQGTKPPLGRLDCPVMEKEQPSTSTHIKSTTSEQGQPDYSIVMDQEQPSMVSTDLQGTIPPLGDTRGNANIVDILMEHNYTVFGKSKRKSGKDMLNASNTSHKMLQPLCRKIRRLQSEISRLRKKNQSFKTRVKIAENLLDDAAFNYAVKNFTTPAKLLLHMQLQSSKQLKGRRFSIEEKVLCLSIYKKSPKCYGLLCKYLTLPSAKAMKRLIAQVKLSAGINPIIFEKIKKTVLDKPASERLCSLIFDEISLTPQIIYNIHNDVFEGFAMNKEGKFADHALVFMVKGVKENFKQSIAYFFTNALTKVDLKKYIKNVIKYTQDAGLIILNTVCD